MSKQFGERLLQEKYQTTKRAAAFYQNQMLDHVNIPMQEFIKKQEMMFIATSDRNGNCDSSFKAGPPGFVRVMNKKTIMYPEYRGNGVMASLGNLTENPHIGLMFIDFVENRVGLHVNGKAFICENKELKNMPIHENVLKKIYREETRAERWVIIEIEEAYIHCSKHIPKMNKNEERNDNPIVAGDFFKVKQSRLSQV
ncbi:pyridoxamine 5'-phosphate oxidase family protein [Halalkalibacter akibai]|uniref:Pyridoxamine 5'-phosphate oxidase N-terminal domain-containing protein n=1 Tax=Halalkalibacter akibai (strain ATCC 43226 / DSM 21942 / CIP 109018 / JCM 9157 / 1139) TaxID=1236973 RepID=W4QRX9_HALA3|nr:pyridoxamine 5'-phosphate oxidase family protein [Halalkalibacter akibai]GAE34393.1 hypothetical protein JCM9157_1447 [Halalkalibacter akibai JCM 9157]